MSFARKSQGQPRTQPRQEPRTQRDTPQNTPQNTSTTAHKPSRWDRNGDGKNDLWQAINKIIDTAITVVTVPFYAVGRILENFTDTSKSGIRAIGAILFCIGVLMSADGIYQYFSGGVALFPWFEERWIGWGWLTIWLSIPFWCALVVSLGVAMIEAQALRGLTPDQAKEKYEAVKHHETPAANPRAINLVELTRQDYKKSGTKERSIFTIVAVLVFAFDAGSVIYGRNPFGSDNFFGILLFDAFTMLAAEAGYVMWKKANGR
jgi:hypothetical protein